MKNKKRLGIVILIGIACYFCMTPIGALRLEIIKCGHPISAFTIEVMDKSYPMTLEVNQIGYSLENPPFEEDTQSELINWVVTKHGLFYTANYYGWG